MRRVIYPPSVLRTQQERDPEGCERGQGQRGRSLHVLPTSVSSEIYWKMLFKNDFIVYIFFNEHVPRG